MAAILGPANVAWGVVVKKEFPQNSVGNTCAAVLDKIKNDADFNAPDNFGSPKSELTLQNISTGATTTGTGGQQVTVGNTSQNNKFFDWTETTSGGATGIDAILFRGKADNIFFDRGATSGTNIGDISSPAGNPTFVLFCSWNTVTAGPTDHVIAGENVTCESDQTLHNALCETYLADQVSNGRGDAGKPLIPVVYSTGTPGNTVTSACGCLWEKFLPGGSADGEYVVDPASFAQCDKKPICDDVSGNSIVDCAVVTAADFCERDADNTNNCCSGLVTVAPSADFSTTPVGGSCVTEFNIGGITMTYRWETTTSPCPAGWTEVP